jgi:hypothetical protein
LLAIKKGQKAKKDAEAKKKEADAIANFLKRKEAVATAMEVVASLANAKVTTQAPPPTNTPMGVEPDLLECLDSLSDQLTVTAVGHSTVGRSWSTPLIIMLAPGSRCCHLQRGKEETQAEGNSQGTESEQAPQTVVGSEEDSLPDAETHRTVLNQILRQRTTHLKRRYFNS